VVLEVLVAQAGVVLVVLAEADKRLELQTQVAVVVALDQVEVLVALVVQAS
jgi:hypothetical protein